MTVTVCRPTSVVPVGGGARELFEGLWSRLPPFVEDNSFTTLPEDGGVFLKGQRIRPRVHPETLLQAGRLVREVRWLQRFRQAGVPVPELLAHGQERRCGVVTRSFLLLEYLEGAEDLRSVVKRTGPEDRGDVWQPVGEMIAALHAARLFHRDLTARNVLVRRIDGVVHAHLIDCPRAELGWFGPRRAYLRRSDLFRLTRSLAKFGATEDELSRLLVGYGALDAGAVMPHVRRAEGRGRGDPVRTKLWLALGV